MLIKDVINKIESSKEFSEWRKTHKESYLAHIFKMLDDANIDDWQVGYYNKDDTITTFLVSGDKIKIIPEAQIFKRPDAKVLKLNMDKVKIRLAKAVEIATEYQEKHYEQEKPTKEIIILQSLETGQVYNITFVSQRFNILNMKVCCESGKIKEHTLKSIMDFKAK